MKKPRRALCLVVILQLSLILSAAAQCGNTLSTRQYDTLITGIGYGNYHLSFPQWSPDSGTLASVKISAVVNLRYGFTLRNADVVPSTYTVSVGRQDKFSSPALAVPFVNLTEQSIGSFPLDPGNQVSQSQLVLLNNYINTDSIAGQTAPFIGMGKVDFTYSPITYTDVQTNNNASYYYSASAADSIHFSVTYLYCKTGILAVSLIHFMASPEDPNTVQLSWAIAGEQSGRRYEVQQSRDGRDFESVVSLPSLPGSSLEADYSYTDKLPAGTVGKCYFRIKMVDAQGTASYSPIKPVEIGSNPGRGLSLYPNPATEYVNIVFDRAPAGDWQADVLDAAGGLVQRESWYHVNEARLNFRRKLAAGVYFIRATDLLTGKNYVAGFIVR